MENRARLESKHEQELSSASELKDPEAKEKKQQARETNKVTRLDFENRYLDLKDFLVPKRVKPTAEASSLAPPPCQPLSSRFQLPSFKIQSFDGDLTKWISFRDAFKSVIDKDPSLSCVDKLNYLRSLVQLGASTIVEGVDVNETNFEVAWDLLTLRYENNKLISRALMDTEPIKRESYEALITLIDSFERNLMQLKKLGLKTDDWSPILAHLLYSRLDTDTQRHWENHHKSREVPDYKEMLKFLQDHLTTLQPLVNKKPRVQEHRQEASKPTPKTKFGSTLTTTTSSQIKSCPFCQKPTHSPFKCESFLKLNPFQRYELAKKIVLCLNCLNPFHLARACPSSACRVCGQRHHTMLHRRSTNTPNQELTLSHSTTNAQFQTQPSRASNSQSQLQNSAPPMLPSTSDQPSLSLAACTPNNANVVFLSTAVVKIADSHGNTYLARALLDCCSERNLMSERLAQKLVLRRQNDPLSLQGVGSSQAVSKQSTLAKILSRWTDYSIDLKFHILPEFKPIVPSDCVQTQTWTHPISSSLFLADPRFFEPNQIDLIIGAEVHYRLLLNGFIDLGPNLPILKETVFGWIVSGKCSTSSRPSSLTMVCSNADLEKQVARFWELESCHSESVLSVEEKQCASPANFVSRESY
ncbi:uncharacterized protein LOC120429521 [Culex pipiens pallens]|uniref:uncharacterized protein LOC120429521 n=1 Tax=Culex pipiens pallens TaxID=42434 RepID=UPI001953107F|nr:uncharacterized protein LOC120429521 [Culex pipiens pallens]